MWEYWCKAIGSKAYEDDKRADRVAIIRSIWIAFNVIVGLFIIANAIHHW